MAVGAAVGLLPLRGGTDTMLRDLRPDPGAGRGRRAIGGGVYLRTIEAGRERAMDAVRAEQRAEFARDLHDFIAHHVTGIVVQAQGARFVAEQDPQRVLLALEQIEQAGAETMASMRRMVGVLRDPQARPDAPLAPLAGVAELAAAAGAVQRAPAARWPGCTSTATCDGLPVEVSTSAYRVVMEALTNIRQHAAGARVADVWVRRTPDWLLVRVGRRRRAAARAAAARPAGVRSRGPDRTGPRGRRRGSPPGPASTAAGWSTRRCRWTRREVAA